MPDLVLIGGGGHAAVIAEIVRSAQRYRLLGCLADDEPSPAIDGCPWLGTLDDGLAKWVAKVGCFVVAVGDNHVRNRLVQRIEALGQPIDWPALVHDSALVSATAKLDGGAVVMAGAVVQARCRVGAHAVINTRAALDHDGALDDFAMLGPGAVLGGSVHVGAGAMVGLGAVVKQGVRIGRDTVIGAGAVVLRDVPDRVVAFGNPARVIRPRQPGERYL